MSEMDCTSYFSISSYDTMLGQVEKHLSGSGVVTVMSSSYHFTENLFYIVSSQGKQQLCEFYINYDICVSTETHAKLICHQFMILKLYTRLPYLIFRKMAYFSH